MIGAGDMALVCCCAEATPEMTTKNLYLSLVIITTSSIVTACAGSVERPDSTADSGDSRGSDCIHEPSIRGYTVLDEANLIVSAAGKRKYHVELFRRAYGLRSSWAIAFDSATSRVCAGFSKVIFEGHFDDESIPISSIRELTPEAEEDLLIRFGKKEPEIKTPSAPTEVEGAEVEELDPEAGK